MTWVNLNDVYVSTNGGTINGDLAVNGSLTCKNGSTTYNVGSQLAALGDSVSRNGDWYIARVGNNATILFFHKEIAVTNFQAKEYIYKYDLPNNCGTPISGFVNAVQWRVRASRVTFPSNTQVQIVTAISESTSDGTASDPYYNNFDVAIFCVK